MSPLSIALATALGTGVAVQPQPTTAIKLDQVGYPTRGAKAAMLVAEPPATTFDVRRASDGGVAYSGRASAPAPDADSGDRVQLLDFAALETAGTYYVDVPGVGRSWPFAIGDDVYRRAFYLAARSFFGQRCGTAVDLGPDFPGYKYAACHLTGSFHASSGKSGPKAIGKGWHDAGDYGRYVVNSGITTGTLLWTYELFGARVGSVRLDIPESSNPVPDLLDEVRWNLEWMLSMQDEDGGVWHKQTSERFAGFVMPERDTLPSVVVGTGVAPFKSSCATADFAAVLAIAGRVYRPFDAAFASASLLAARRAWSWLQTNPNVTFKNPPGVVTGEYGDGNCSDERLWAAAELWRTTREASFERALLEGLQGPAPRAQSPASWPAVGALAVWTYLLGNPVSGPSTDALRQETLLAADSVVERTARHPYRISMQRDDYVWGSNGVAANYGVQLIVANAIRQDPRYVATALDNLHYLLGRNTFSLSWVTQVGANPFRHPHHRPSGADDRPEPWPGLLSGGPNSRKQDPAMEKLPDLPPAKMYVDVQESYASNENAINWNAPLVLVLAGMLTER